MHRYSERENRLITIGIVSTGLELWEGEECAKKYFRQRMWGTLTMIETLLLDPKVN
jgi:phospholipid:diacylglycerol acyltransferase